MIYTEICQAKASGKRLLAILIDPDHLKKNEIDQLIFKIEKSPATHIFVGGSLLQRNEMDEVVSLIKAKITLPVVLFPGNFSQITSKADAVLFLSLLSGRNPEYLIGQHVHAAPLLKKMNLEILPTAYLLIDGGVATSVSYMSNTNPIPRNKKDIALATALAGEMLGNKLVYLEAGSGANQSVPTEMVELLSENLDIPIIVGGGLKSLENLKEMYKAGATMLVVGTAFENDSNFFHK